MDDICKIMADLNVGNAYFWRFLKGKIKVLPLGVQEFPWGCFLRLDRDGVLVDIRILVPKIVDEATLLVNIHELTHAYELFGKLNLLYEENRQRSEELAVSKEQEYLLRFRNKK